jgi:hypothetical protein
LNVFFQNLRLEPLGADGPIDAGAEEELFRDLGRQAAAEVLARRWENAGTGSVGKCRDCGGQLQDLGLRSKRFQTLCGPIQLRRRMGPDNLVQVIADGAPWIWNLADLHFPGVAQLLDFYHAAEHLHETATALWPERIANIWWCRRLD